MKQITPFLWFDTQAEDAAKFYTQVFKNSRINQVTRYGDAGPGPKGSVMTVDFDINGQNFVAINGGKVYKLTPAVSFVVNCDSQAEVDQYWDALVAGGQPVQCGWLTDKFGLSWQIVPTAMVKLITDPDPIKATRAMKAMMTMVKLDLAALQKAHDG